VVECRTAVQPKTAFPKSPVRLRFGPIHFCSLFALFLLFSCSSIRQLFPSFVKMLTSSKTFDFKNQMCIMRFTDAITAEYNYHLERIAVTLRKTKTILHTYCQAEERSTNIFGSWASHPALKAGATSASPPTSCTAMTIRRWWKRRSTTGPLF